MYTLIAKGREWDYDTEPQLRTAARLYAIQNPGVEIAVSIRGQRHVVRKGA